MAKRRIRIPIRVKTIIMIVVFGMVLAEVAMVYFSLVSSNNNKEHYKNLANDISSTIALSIDKEKVTSLTNDVVKIYDASSKPVREQSEGTPEYEAYLASFEQIKQTPAYIEIKAILSNIQQVTEDVDSVYLGYVDRERKLCVFLVYDHETELFPIGVIDPLYEEDYPMVDDPLIGFRPSIYYSEVDNQTLVTAGSPIVNAKGEVICYALVDISMNAVRSKQAGSIVRLFFYLVASVILLSGLGFIVVSFTLLKPVRTLQNAAKSYDISKPEETHEIFSKLQVNVHDEFEDLATSMKQMEEDIYGKMHDLTMVNAELKEAQLETEKMTELANKDALTGVRNKAAYDNQVEEINAQIKEGAAAPFGIAMVDLNYLKNINDEYGHQSGNAALIKLCNLICATFAHSSVYRVGGDEFVVLFKGRDLQNEKKLIKEFNQKIEELQEDDSLTPAEKISAAIGYSRFEPKKDACVDDVFKRADHAMYVRKKKMKEKIEAP